MAKRKYVSGPRFERRVRRRSLLRRTSMSRIKRRRRNPTHNFTRTVQLANIDASHLANVYGAITFKLTDLPNYTEFTNLFDRYRINAVKLTIVPLVTSNDVNPATTLFTLPNVHTAIDYNDNSNPGSMNELMQYSNYRCTRANKVHSRYFKPSVLQSNYETAVATAYTPAWKRWLTCDDPVTPHYCLKYGLDTPNGNIDLAFRVYAKYYFQCKDLR